MAVNYDINVFKNNVVLTRKELNNLILTQRQAMSYIKNKETNIQVIGDTIRSLTGLSATILGLLFVTNTSVGIGAGIAGLASTLGGAARTNILALAENGEKALLNIHFTMSNLNADKISMDMAFVKVYDQATLKEYARAVQAAEINYYEKNGVRTYA